MNSSEDLANQLKQRFERIESSDMQRELVMSAIRRSLSQRIRNNILDFLDNGKLLSCSGELVEARRAIRNKNIILFYFSASWCTPCRVLLPKIKEIYKVSKERKLGVEIIYVSADTDKETMLKYFLARHGGWYAVPHDDGASEILRRLFNVTYIPQIVVVKTDGTNISRQGTKDIESLGTNALIAWSLSPTE